jgi:hypothetical protein
MKNNRIKPAKKKDFAYFFKDERTPYSAKAWVLFSGKDRVAIGGIWLMPKQFTAFVRVKKNIPKKSFWKASIEVNKKLIDTGYPIICFRDETTINSKKYLEKLGYQYYNTINNQEIYKLWAQQQYL